MAIETGNNEVVHRATSFQIRKIAMSDQSSPTDKSKAHLGAVCRDKYQQVYLVDEECCKAANWGHNNEVDRMVTKVVVQQQLQSHAAWRSQCELPITTDWKICSPEHAETLKRARTEQAHLNMICKSILGNHMCYMSMNETTCNGLIRLTATPDAGSRSSHHCQVMSTRSTTLVNSVNHLRRDRWTTSVVLDGGSDAVWVLEWRYGGIEVRGWEAQEMGQ